MFSNLPTAVEFHCMVKINNTILLQIGGTVNNSYYSGITENTHFFDIILNEWIPGPKLNAGRIHHSCAVMNWINPNTGTPEKVRY